MVVSVLLVMAVAAVAAGVGLLPGVSVACGVCGCGGCKGVGADAGDGVGVGASVSGVFEVAAVAAVAAMSALVVSVKDNRPVAFEMSVAEDAVAHRRWCWKWPLWGGGGCRGRGLSIVVVGGCGGDVGSVVGGVGDCNCLIVV